MEKENARSFRDLAVWRKAHNLVLEVYSVTRDFPKKAWTNWMRLDGDSGDRWNSESVALGWILAPGQVPDVKG